MPLAYSSAFTMAAVEKSFRVTGIWPVDASQIAGHLHHAVGAVPPPAIAVHEIVGKSKEEKDSLDFYLLLFFFFLISNVIFLFFIKKFF
jgi:hypothetical protein